VSAAASIATLFVESQLRPELRGGKPDASSGARQLLDVNIITGFGAEAGAPLITYPMVSKISFTGAIATGRRVAGIAGEVLKGVILELGGKSPLIVFDDANLPRAASAAVFSTFKNAGRICTSCARVLVARPLIDQFSFCALGAVAPERAICAR